MSAAVLARPSLASAGSPPFLFFLFFFSKENIEGKIGKHPNTPTSTSSCFSVASTKQKRLPRSRPRRPRNHGFDLHVIHHPLGCVLGAAGGHFLCSARGVPTDLTSRPRSLNFHRPISRASLWRSPLMAVDARWLSGLGPGRPDTSQRARVSISLCSHGVVAWLTLIWSGPYSHQFVPRPRGNAPTHAPARFFGAVPGGASSADVALALDSSPAR